MVSLVPDLQAEHQYRPRRRSDWVDFKTLYKGYCSRISIARARQIISFVNEELSFGGKFSLQRSPSPDRPTVEVSDKNAHYFSHLADLRGCNIATKPSDKRVKKRVL